MEGLLWALQRKENEVGPIGGCQFTSSPIFISINKGV